MTPEVKELYDALVKPATPYCDAVGEYARLREKLIAELGYDAFRDRQNEAFREIAKAGKVPVST